jgi:hypothetical protein
MKSIIVHTENEEGFVIVLVLMILVVVSIIGISSNRTSIAEKKIVRNERQYKEVFFDADSGPYTIAKLVSKTVDEKTAQQANDFNFVFLHPTDTDPLALEDHVFRQIMGFDDHDGGGKDVSFANTLSDIKRDRTTHAPGGATEFGSGADGVGTGSKGGVEIYFNLDSDGLREQNRSVNIIGIYRKVPDITGGL